MTRRAGLANLKWSAWTRRRWLTLTLIALWLTLVLISVIAVTSLANRMAFIAHTHNVIAGLTAIQSRITDVETAQRGYVLTGRSDYLEPIVDAEGDLTDMISRVRALTRDNPTQQANLASAEKLIFTRIELSRAIVRVFDAAGIDAARQFANSRGKALHDRIRGQILIMVQVETALLERREAAAALSRRNLNWSIGFALVLLAGCIVLSWRLGREKASAISKLDQAELQYRELFESSPFPIGIIDLATQDILLANQATVDLFGYDRETLTSMKFTNLFQASERGKLHIALQSIMGGGYYPLMVWKQRRADGSELDTEIVTRSVPSVDNGPGVVMAIITEVTEREKLLSEIRRSESDLHEIFDLQYQMLATFSPEGRILRANDLFVSTCEIDRSRLASLNLDALPLRFFEDGSPISPWRLGQIASNTSEPKTLRMRLVRDESADDRIFDAVVRRVLQEDGSMFIIFQARDVTDTVHMMNQLTTTTRRLLAAQDRAGMCIWEWDAVANTMWWSRNSARVLHVAEGELPTNIDAIVALAAEHDAPRVAAFLNEMQDVIGGSYMRFQAKACEGHDECHFELTVERIPGTGGNKGQLVGNICDITNDIALEARLSQSQRLEAVGKLTGGVAHDFNNLLTVIIGSSEVLVHALTKDPQLHELASLNLAAAGRGAELTAQLLAFARRQPLEPQLVSPSLLLREMNSLLRKTLTPGIELDIVTDAGAWKTMVDPALLESAILNLAINSRDAMPEGGRLVIEVANARLDGAYAAAHSDVTEGSYVMIAVSDTGSGMPAAVSDRVFEPFFTTKKGGDNSGLGLSMVHGFIKQSGGHIKIYSEVHNGTTVRIYLPRHFGTVKNSYPQPFLDGEIRGGTERILLVEDDDLVREHVAKQLTGLGYRVATASNGDEALALFEGDRDFDLLFTDVVMPGGINGRQLAKSILTISPDLPVLFTSGYTENAIVHHGRLDSGVLLLSKPYRLSMLASKLRQALD